MNILIINQPLGNRGDESAHRGFINSLIKKYPNAKIKVLFYGAKRSIDAFKVHNENVKYVNSQTVIPDRIYRRIFKYYTIGFIPLNLLRIISSFNVLVKYYNGADVVVCAPGGICLGGFKVWSHAGMLKIAKDLNKTLGYFARSIGPYDDNTKENAQFKRASIDLLTYCKSISLRDEKSLAIADELGLKAIKTIDSAFLASADSEVPSTFVNMINGSKYFVFVPNALVWHYKYKHISHKEILSFWIKLTDKLLLKHPTLKIAMLPQTMGYNTKCPDGYVFFTSIKEQCCCPDRVVVLDEQYGSDVQQKIISKAEFLIGARYHSIVFSINQLIPFISLTYEHKMSGLLAMLGLDNRQINIEDHFVGENHNSDDSTDNLVDEIIQRSTALIIDNDKIITARDIAEDGFEQFFTSLI